MTMHMPNGKAESGGAGRRELRDQWLGRPRPIGARGVAAPPGAEGAIGAARAAPAPGERRRGALPLSSLPVLSCLLSNPSLPLSPRRVPARPRSWGCPALPCVARPCRVPSRCGAAPPPPPAQPRVFLAAPRALPWWIPTATPLLGAGFPWRRRPPPPAAVPPPPRC